MNVRALIVQGMAFGDEGKGATVDWLTRKHKAGLVVRFNGGSQAAHNVVTPDGTHHTFAQFGAGTLAGARTHLSRFMLVDPYALDTEAEVLRPKIARNPYDILTVDPGCVVITPYHQIANRLRERCRGENRHGSVGVGVGEARSDAINGLALKVKDLYDLYETESKLEAVWRAKKAEFPDGVELDIPFHSVARSFNEWVDEVDVRGTRVAIEDLSGKAVVFEGAQGVLLDETYGFAPYNSWTNCTFENAEELCEEAGIGKESRTKIGVFRSYFTRHGPGPFPTESKFTNNDTHPEVHNGMHPWMGEFRRGWFDLTLARYACRVAKPDGLVFTHWDRFEYSDPIAVNYVRPVDSYTTEELNKAIPIYSRNCPTPPTLVSYNTDVPVVARSIGPTHLNFLEEPT